MLMARRCVSLSKSANRNLGIGFCWRRWVSSSEEKSTSKRFVALWGNGDFGRLGLGSLESKWRPSFCSAFGDGNVREVACGGAHTLFLTDTGSVYATGLNDCGQLGISDGRSYTIDPVEVSGLPKEITKISAGYYHSSAITVNGELYMWGKNSSGQLGIGRNAAKVVPVPSKVDCLNGVPIKMAALGSEHSIALTGKGEALSWGGGESGRLGHGHNSSILGFLSSTSEYTPRLIKRLEGIKIRSVAAGMLHSACIDEHGSVFVFGEKAVEKLGFRGGNTVTTPSMISELPCSEEIACGAHHTCVITSYLLEYNAVCHGACRVRLGLLPVTSAYKHLNKANISSAREGGGELYTWGSNENGCLGIGCTDNIHVPERVEGPFLRQSVCKVSCGWKHTAAISDGNVYTWGWGGSQGTFSEDGHSSGGQLGLGNDVDYIEPTMVNFGKSVKALQVSCGFNHTGAILEYN